MNKKYKVRAIVLKIVAFFISLLPLGIYLFVEREKYFKTMSKASMGAGFFILLVVVLISLKDRLGDLLKSKALLKVSIFMMFFCWIFVYISDTMLVLSFFAFVGGALALVPEHYAKKNLKLFEGNYQADLTTKAVAQYFEKNKLEVIKK